MPPTMRSRAHFLGSFLRDAGGIGAVAPSSPALARRMVEWFDWERIGSVVEYGPGTGVFTEQIERARRPGSRFFAIERDPRLAALTRERCPGVTVREDSVVRVAELCRSEGVESVDAVLCGLPWASFSEDLQEQCLDALFEVLAPGGRFATFAYWQGLALPAGQRFRRKLRERFGGFSTSPTVWRNLPPAFVYRCVR